jgi:hypothetical protein
MNSFMAHEFDILVTLHEIRDLLKTQNDILEKQQNQSQTKITVVGNKVQNQIPKGLKNDEDFTL